MNQMVSMLQDKEVTMSSKEIADLLGSEHSSVKRSIDRLVKSGAIQDSPLVNVEKINGLGLKQKTSIYVFSGEQGKRDSIILVAQMSPTFTAALVDRWIELENKINSLQLPDFNNPAIAARAWADEYEKRIEYQQQLQIAAPKAEVYDVIVECSHLMSATQVAKKLGMSATKMNGYLLEFGVYNKRSTKSKVFNQWWIDKGYGEVKATDNGFTQSKFTNEGQAWIVSKFISEGIIDTVVKDVTLIESNNN